jgi:hypothetical protein
MWITHRTIDVASPQQNSAGSSATRPDAGPATRQRHLPGPAAAGSGMMGGRAPRPRATTPAAATTRLYQRRRCARPARHRDEHASQRTRVKARAPAASGHVAAASAPPCPSVTSGYKAHMAAATRARMAKRYYAWTGSERPQTGIWPKSRGNPWHAPPHLTCFASRVDSKSRASPTPMPLLRSRRCSPADPGAREGLRGGRAPDHGRYLRLHDRRLRALAGRRIAGAPSVPIANEERPVVPDTLGTTIKTASSLPGDARSHGSGGLQPAGRSVTYL